MNGKVPQYSETPLYLQTIGTADGVSEYRNTPVWMCHTCGLVAADKTAHTRFHQDLYRSACRG